MAEYFRGFHTSPDIFHQRSDQFRRYYCELPLFEPSPRVGIAGLRFASGNEGILCDGRYFDLQIRRTNQCRGREQIDLVKRIKGREEREQLSGRFVSRATGTTPLFLFPRLSCRRLKTVVTSIPVCGNRPEPTLFSPTILRG